MVILIALCNNYSCTLAKFIKHKPNHCLYLSKVLCSGCTDSLVDNLAIEEGIKQESNLTKFFEKIHSQHLEETFTNFPFGNKKIFDLQHKYDIKDLTCSIENEINTRFVPNEKLKYLLVYFSKHGNVDGVKAVQSIVEKYNLVNFKTNAEYNHYLAEAFWIIGKIQTSIQLFSLAYDNFIVKPKVKVMLPNLFPSLTAQHSEATICKVIYDIELFAAEKRDNLILAFLWRELFLSSWFSDQEQASKLLLKNNHLIKHIQWMVPSMGRNLLKSHRVEDFYRLIQFTLENELKPVADTLIRLLFDYYYIHQNIARCTAVVKFSSTKNTPLTEEQQRRYVSLLMKSKNSFCSKSIVKKPQNLKYKF